MRESTLDSSGTDFGPEENYSEFGNVLFTLVGPCIASIFQYISNKM
jgi:hypothetical protein